MKVRRISRSSAEEFNTCRRRGFLRYLFRGKGVEPSTPSVPLIVGLGLHKGQEVLFKTGGDIETAVDAVDAEWSAQLHGNTVTAEYDEGRATSVALLMGWFRTRYEAFLERFKVLRVETETESMLAPNVILQAREDLTAKEIETGNNYVFNWKTTREINRWNEKWANEVQTWTESLAAEDALGEPIEGVIYEGFYKGQVYKGSPTSPLLRGFTDGTTFTHESKKSNKTTTWTRFSPWKVEFPFGSGLAAWVGFLPEDVVSAQYIRSRPIPINRDVVREWVASTVREETDNQYIIDNASEEEQMIFFRQRRGEWCFKCPFLPICDRVATVDSMLEAGNLRPRVDHHGEQPV